MHCMVWFGSALFGMAWLKVLSIILKPGFRLIIFAMHSITLSGYAYQKNCKVGCVVG